MPARRVRHEDEEEHVNHERWLVTYADMVTLLMVLFIVMFAMSQVDEKKFMELKEGLAAGFQNSESVLPGSESILNEPGLSQVQKIAPGSTLQTGNSSTGDNVNASASGAEQAKQAADQARERREKDELEKAQKQIAAALRAHHLDDDVQTALTDRGLVISLVSRHVVFAANLAELTPRGQQVVDTLGPVLAALPENLEIDGHTNQAPGKPKYYATDWDLSAARAISVLRRLNEHVGLPAARLSIGAFGDTRPLQNPSEPGSQQVNKRVDIVVLTTHDQAQAVADQLDSSTVESTTDRSSSTPGASSTTSDTSASSASPTLSGTTASSTRHARGGGSARHGAASRKGSRR